MTHDEIVAEFHARVGRDYRPKVIKHTVPYYILDVNSKGEDRVRHDKTGVFLHVGNDYFILTASHSLAKNIKNEHQLFLGDVVPGEDPITCIGVEFNWTESAIRDIAIFKIPAEKAERLMKKYDCATMSDIGHDQSDTYSHYLLVGYPGRWSSISKQGGLKGHPMSYLCTMANFDPSIAKKDIFEPDPAIHRMFNYDRWARHEPSGRVEELPTPKGMSGCGIWLVGTIKGEKLLYPPSPRLIGIQTKHSEDKNLIVTTGIEYAIGALVDAYPSLREPILLSYPHVLQVQSGPPRQFN